MAALLSTAVLTAGISTAQADDKKAPEKKQADKKKKSGFFPFRGLIKSVDVDKKTITLPGAKGKPDRVFFDICCQRLLKRKPFSCYMI